MKLILFILLVTHLLLLQLNASRNEFKPLNTFKLSFLYTEDKENIEDYVSNAIEIINEKLVKRSFQFEYYIDKVKATDSFLISKQLCKQLNDGRLIVIGIGSNPALNDLETIASELKIPFIAIKYDDALDEENNIISKKSEDADYTEIDQSYGADDEYSKMTLLNMQAPLKRIMNAVIDLTEYYKWDHAAVLYQESLGIEHIQHLIRMPSLKVGRKQLGIMVRQLSTDIDEWIYLLKDVKLSGLSHIIVDIETKYLNEFVKQATEIGMMTGYFHFLFTTLDLSVMSSIPEANVTAFQIYRPHDTAVDNLLTTWNIKNTLQKKNPQTFLTSDAVLIYDTLELIANTIIENDLVSTIASKPYSVSCQKETKWNFGPTFLNYLKQANFTGLSGEISFNPKTGERNNIFLYIVDMTRTGVDLFGFWTENRQTFNKSIYIIRSYTKERDHVMDKLNKNLIVTSKLEDPYIMRKQPTDGKKFYGNDRYEGYCVDLIEKISKICGFNYTIKLVDDNLYGTIVNGKWNGLVKDLIDKKADLALAALTINYQREQVIDFTKPFLNLGTSILYKRPQKNTPELFSFLYPLSIDVWLYMIAAYVGLSLILFVLARFSPYEWQSPHPCQPDSGLVENQFTVLNSLWFTIGSLMQQGTDINPRSPSVRLISCVWAFFTLILISSYTANLAAFLTVQRLKNPIESVEDLSKQTEIKYGSLKGGSTEQFFRVNLTGIFMLDSTDLNPVACSTRIVTGVWWAFTLILLSSYTANLAAFLTHKRLTTPIEDVETLSKQTDVKYGCLAGGSTQQFFQESNIQTYARMWSFMSNNPDVFVNSTEMGIKRVKSGSYAFLMDSTMNEFARQRDCDLMQVGGLLDSKGYGIGTPTGSPWTDQISNAILKLQEDGVLQYLYTTWWKKQKGALVCDNTEDKKKDLANELGLDNVGGVFVVLVAGLCISVVVAILEFIWKARQHNHETTIKEQIVRECKFALCHYNKAKKSTALHFPKLSLNNVIKIIPPSEVEQPVSATSLNASIASNQSVLQQMISSRESSKSLQNTPNRHKKTPQLQHKYLK